eukprot:4121447-Amphidinium_carterae.1
MSSGGKGRGKNGKFRRDASGHQLCWELNRVVGAAPSYLSPCKRAHVDMGHGRRTVLKVGCHD